MAVEVWGVSTRVGHRTCTRASLHVRHTGSFEWALCSYIRIEYGNCVLSVCVILMDVNQ